MSSQNQFFKLKIFLNKTKKKHFQLVLRFFQKWTDFFNEKISKCIFLLCLFKNKDKLQDVLEYNLIYLLFGNYMISELAFQKCLLPNLHVF